MSSNTINSAIGDYVFQENKIVTFKWLSKRFKLHVNDAKDYLETFYARNRGKQNLNATFYLSGYVTRDYIKIFTVRLVREEDLQKAEEGFVDVGSKHVYSLQCCCLKDLSPVYLADEDYCLKEYSAVKFAFVEFRQETESSSKEANVAQPKNDLSSTTKSVIQKNNVLQSKKSPAKEPNLKKSTIPSMFTAMRVEKDDVKVAKKGCMDDDGDSLMNSQDDEKHQNGLNHDQNGVNHDQKEEEKPKSGKKKECRPVRSVCTKNKVENCFKNNDLFAADSSPEKSPTKKSITSSLSPTNLRRSPRNRKSSAADNVSPSTPPPSKKVKRSLTKKSKAANKKKIEVEQDEDEDDKNIDEDDNDFVRLPPTPVLPESQVTSATFSKQKWVHKSYVDDDGYLVTTKEPVVETFAKHAPTEDVKLSESVKPKVRAKAEDKVAPSKSGKSAKSAKGGSPKKQMSLTSFFKM